MFPIVLQLCSMYWRPHNNTMYYHWVLLLGWGGVKKIHVDMLWFKSTFGYFPLS